MVQRNKQKRFFLLKRTATAGVYRSASQKDSAHQRHAKIEINQTSYADFKIFQTRDGPARGRPELLRVPESETYFLSCFSLAIFREDPLTRTGVPPPPTPSAANPGSRSTKLHSSVRKVALKFQRVLMRLHSAHVEANDLSLHRACR